MNLDLLAPLILGSLVGYGEVENGQPNWSQREMQTVTNLVRVDPTAWSRDYDCSLSEFSAQEKLPLPPLYYHDGLTTIAQLHSEDQNQWQNMSHDSSNGTDFGTRTWPYYDGNTIGENVAWNYADNWDVVLEGWMCSAGHRENIMSADFEHIGTGLDNRYYTQDFGGGAILPDTPVAMGVHTPENPRSAVEFWATWDDARPPAALDVETEITCEPMERIVGSENLGGWHRESDAVTGCVSYRFRWELSNGAVGFLPETGSWQYGTNCPLWIEEEPTGCTPEPEPEPEDDNPPEDEEGPDDSGTSEQPVDEGCGDLDFVDRNGDCLPDNDRSPGAEGDKALGCSSAPAAPTPFWSLLLAAAALGRRAQTRRG